MQMSNYLNISHLKDTLMNDKYFNYSYDSYNVNIAKFKIYELCEKFLMKFNCHYLSII